VRAAQRPGPARDTDGAAPEIRLGARIDIVDEAAAAPASVTAAARAPVTAAAQPADAGARVRADERERDHLRPTSTAAPAGPAADPARHLADRADSRHPDGPGDSRPTCTVAQLRRFIKSRPWVPMHELRRRFGINGVEDDVTPIRVGGDRLYVGLPSTEGHLMAELLGGGDVGYELSMDPDVPVVVGVYPMRPVPRS